jgi:hypothetical protein
MRRSWFRCCFSRERSRRQPNRYNWSHAWPTASPGRDGEADLGSTEWVWHNRGSAVPQASVMLSETLARLAQRVSDPEYDPRHAILDISAELLALNDIEPLPPALQVEWRELRDEVRAVQPAFPSRRTTSPLFDRTGLGRPGVERAERLIGRLIALARAANRSQTSQTSGS